MCFLCSQRVPLRHTIDTKSFPSVALTIYRRNHPVSVRPMPVITHYRLPEVIEALRHHRYIKLILGASFKDTELIEKLCTAYALSGVQVFDLAADPSVLETVLESFKRLALDHPGPTPIFPALMVSLDVDGDPHFKTIELQTEACIQCSACIPVCPTQVFALPDTPTPSHPLDMVHTRCYGCNQCIPVCPTEALSLHPITQASETLQTLLRHPAITMVELHTEHLNQEALLQLLTSLEDGLKDKLLSLCWRPVTEEASLACKAQEQTFLATFDTWVKTINTHKVWMAQVDGIAMGGAGYQLQQQGIQTSNTMPSQTSPHAYAWHVAYRMHARYHTLSPSFNPPWTWLTLSGGISPESAVFYRHPVQQARLEVHGAGMGSMAKKMLQLVPSHTDSAVYTRQLQEKAISAIQPFLLP
ncbi:MAG: NADH-quinone oxidoreductase subunit I [Vampirovibrionales bacterium]